MTRILIVRLSALGDIVHALPVVPALAAAYPGAEIDWVVDARYERIFDHVDGVHRRIVVRAADPSTDPARVAFAGTRSGWLGAVRYLRSRRYDAALDLQGLLKSAVVARASGARRVIGFEKAGLREPQAAWFYKEAVRAAKGLHVIRKNLAALATLDAPANGLAFPVRVPASDVAARVVADAAARGDGRFVLVNAGGAWPNKRWEPARFGELAGRLFERRQLPSFVLWGPGEEDLAQAVVDASRGGAVRAPATSLGDVLALASRAALLVSGDTGPLHLAAAVGTPIVGLYGPTWPQRNGPFDTADIVISRAPACGCHHKRVCERDRRCLDDVSVDNVYGAVERRLATGRVA